MADRPTGLSIFTCNRLEPLLVELDHRLAAAPLPPFEPEVVVVQSQGMRRWVTLELARRAGIAASLRMPFPGEFCRSLTREVEGGPPRGADPFDRDALRWRLFGLLGALPPSPAFDPLRRYLDGPERERKRYQLALRLAGRFDDYQLYRPDLLAGWLSEPQRLAGLPHEGFQAELFRLVAAASDEPHLGGRLEALVAGLGRGAPPPRLPSRLSLFGISSLPPVVVRLVAALSRHAQVDLYVVTPTSEYWADDLTAREARRARRGAAAPDEAHLEAGHRLLAAFGKQGRDLLALLLEVDPSGSSLVQLDPVRPGRGSALHALQSDVLELVARGGPSDPEPALPLAADDRSLSVACCHSPLREMEVLRDQLLAAFDEDPSLRPDDVLVMVPDIAVYEPFLRAAFEGPEEVEGGPPRIPISIADRAVAKERPLAAAFLSILDLARGRLGASEVLRPLADVEAVRRRFGLAEEEVPVLESWVEASAIRWGADGAHRARAFGLPAEEANTWRQGLDRLLLGYGTGPVDDLVAGLLPVSEATASRADLLGRFAAYAELALGLPERLAEPRSLAAWAAELRLVLADFFELEGEVDERGGRAVEEALAELEAGEALAGPGPVELEVVLEHLGLAFADEGFGSGFITGRVTACALKPMRTIPFRVIAVAGLSAGAFPRIDRPPPFDCIAAAPRRGDRSVRDDDRYLFLETLLAAGDRLILSWVGRSARTNDELAPSVCLAELLDEIDRAFSCEGGGRPSALVVTEHPLQPFSPSYFGASGDPRLFSYSRDDALACLAAAAPAAPPRPFAPAGTAVPAPAPEAVTLAELAAFWIEPSKAFCGTTLGVRLVGPAEAGEDVEPFDLGRLDEYGLLETMVGRRLARRGARLDDGALLRATGLLPPGVGGDLDRVGLAERAEGLAGRLLGRAFEPPVLLRLEDPATGLVVTGRVDGLSGEERVAWRAWAVGDKDLLRAWIAHLALAAWERGEGHGPGRRTLVLGTDRAVQLAPPEDPVSLLSSLLEGYRAGLASPLPVYLRASRAYVDALRNAERGSRSTKDPLDAARAAFRGSERSAGDLGEPHVALLCRDRDPFADAAEAFAGWSLRLWGPLLDHLEEVAP